MCCEGDLSIIAAQKNMAPQKSRCKGRVEYQTVGNSKGRMSIRSEKMNTAKSEDKAINPEPRMTRTRSLSSNSCEFIAKHSRDNHSDFSQRRSRNTSQAPLNTTGSQGARIPREGKPNKSRNLCRDPFDIPATSRSEVAIWRALWLILICQR